MEQKKLKNIYVAWSNNQTSYSFIATLKTIEALGCKPIILDMVKANYLTYSEENSLVNSKDEHGILLSEEARKVKEMTYHNSNIESIAKDVDCVIFPGGSDVCPTLYKIEQGWHGIVEATDYSAERDVSDYLLMSYCIDKDIPMLAICRGMQLLSIIHGASIISDIVNFANELYDVHLDKNRILFKPHGVDILSKDSLMYKSTGKMHLEDLPSWHHQAVKDLDGTKLSITADATINGINIIEAVERKDKSFCLGVQFHPEVAVRKHLEHAKDCNDFTEYDMAISFFNNLKKHVEK